MARQQISLKQLAINKDNTAIIVAVGIAAFVVVFSLVASKALLDQRSYQARVIGKKKIALKQLKQNVTEVDKLKNSYQVFSEANQNVLGGSSSGSGDKDGPNARLVLDALPSKYDFPALTTSLDKVFKQYRVTSIAGVDDEVTQSGAQASGTPAPVEMPFTIVVDGPSQSSKDILSNFEKSIRPIQLQTLSIAGDSTNLKFTVKAKTYFQPQKKFDVKTEKVK